MTTEHEEALRRLTDAKGRKIDLMHREFGFSPGHKCQYCDNLIVQQANRRYYKCEVYGVTDSEASDWRLSYDACGMYNRVWNGNPIIRLVRGTPKVNDPIEGQESFFKEEKK